MSEGLLELSYDVISQDFIRAGEASSDIKRVLMQLGVKNSTIKRICVACYEAELNIVIHSFGGNIRVTLYEDKIIIVARDRGPGIEDIDLAMQEGYSTANDDAREMGFGAGMGLPNIKKNCDVLKINTVINEYTEIHMEINL